MPIFDYNCAACDERFEQLVNADEDRDAIACPRCQSVQTKRLMARFAGHSQNSRSQGAAPPGSQSAHSCGSPGCCRVAR